MPRPRGVEGHARDLDNEREVPGDYTWVTGPTTQEPMQPASQAQGGREAEVAEFLLRE